MNETDLVRDPDVGVSVLQGAPSGLAQELVAVLGASGARVRVDEREARPFASVEWLAPTAIVLYLAGPYVRTLMSEAAKDHYPAIKGALRTFVAKVGMLDVVRLSSGRAKLANEPPGNLSIVVESESGARIPFIFPAVRELHDRALSSLLSILESEEGRKGLSRALAEHLPDVRLAGRIVARYTGETDGWVLWDPIGEQEWPF